MIIPSFKNRAVGIFLGTDDEDMCAAIDDAMRDAWKEGYAYALNFGWAEEQERQRAKEKQ